MNRWCEDCDGRGWIHMDDSMGRGPDIERCDSCVEYDGDCEARAAHDRECPDRGCPWRTSTPGARSDDSAALGAILLHACDCCDAAYCRNGTVPLFARWIGRHLGRDVPRDERAQEEFWLEAVL